MKFDKWLNMRLDEETNKSLFKETGVGIWINPDDKVYEFRDVIHAAWADAHGLDMNDMLRSGWVRMRILADVAYAETTRESAIWTIASTADAHGIKRVQLFLNGRESEMRKSDVWRLDDEPLSNVFEEFEAIHRSSTLSKLQLEALNRPSYSAADVIDVLNKGGIKSVLVGAQAIAQHTKTPRATEDVDVVVSDVDQAMTTIKEKWPHLIFNHDDPVVRVMDGEHVVIDLIKPVDLYASALTNNYAGRIGNVKVSIPTVELAIAMKYAAMASPHRETEKKYLDASDFIRLVNSKEDLDLNKASKFVAHLYSGAGEEVKRYVQDVKSGKSLVV